MNEAMWAYQELYGLKPIGPHRYFAEDRLGKHTTTCVYCNGNGVVNEPSAWTQRTWRFCPRCNGLRMLVTCSRGEFEAARAEVLKAYPDARIERTQEYRVLSEDLR